MTISAYSTKMQVIYKLVVTNDCPAGRCSFTEKMQKSAAFFKESALAYANFSIG